MGVGAFGETGSYGDELNKLEVENGHLFRKAKDVRASAIK